MSRTGEHTGNLKLCGKPEYPSLLAARPKPPAARPLSHRLGAPAVSRPRLAARRAVARCIRLGVAQRRRLGIGVDAARHRCTQPGPGLTQHRRQHPSRDKGTGTGHSESESVVPVPVCHGASAAVREPGVSASKPGPTSPGRATVTVPA